MKEKVFFEDEDSNKLCGILSDKGKTSIVVMCHGFSSSKDGKTYLRLEGILNENDISTFRFDFYGHGESEGKFENITLSKAVKNLLGAISFLKSIGYEKFGLFGSSFGGIVSIIVASQINNLIFLALKSPVSFHLGRLVARNDEKTIKEWKEKGFIYYDIERQLKLNYSFFKDAEKINAYEFAKRINVPTLIVHGDRDENVPIEQSKGLSRIIENCELRIIKGADHRYTNPEHFERMI